MLCKERKEGNMSSHNVNALTETLFKGKFNLSDEMFQKALAKGEIVWGKNDNGMDVVCSLAFFSCVSFVIPPFTCYLRWWAYI